LKKDEVVKKKNEEEKKLKIDVKDK